MYAIRPAGMILTLWFGSEMASVSLLKGLKVCNCKLIGHSSAGFSHGGLAAWIFCFTDWMGMRIGLDE